MHAGIHYTYEDLASLSYTHAKLSSSVTMHSMHNVMPAIYIAHLEYRQSLYELFCSIQHVPWYAY